MSRADREVALTKYWVLIKYASFSVAVHLRDDDLVLPAAEAEEEQEGFGRA